MRKTIFLIFLILLTVTLTVQNVYATPSKNFYAKNGDKFDDWGIARTRAYGLDGFFQVTEKAFKPIIVFESLGENVNLAYQLGKKFAEKYPNPVERAEKIFVFVRNNVQYVSDVDQFNLQEFAQNADEVAETIVKQGFAKGDCEDMAILLAVMFKGAGLRSAIVLAPGHAATLVYLPEYRKANVFFSLKGETGWIWAEATGKRNPLGWAPEEFIDKKLYAYEVTYEPIATVKPPKGSEPVMVKGGEENIPLNISPFFLILMLMWFFSMFRRKR
ncbi:transglutaminase domain-containing protein [Candidatus Bathyarchaeota archaeon]|nr:MAG: transglutaminase domain-containing protein [Candidatus Bathyarchaeota archaeon]